MDSMGGSGLVRRYEQGEQLPLFAGSRSSRRGRTRGLVLVHTLFGLLGERQYGDSGHRGRGMGLGFSLFFGKESLGRRCNSCKVCRISCTRDLATADFWEVRPVPVD